MRSLFLSQRFYWMFGGLVVLFFLSFGLDFLFPVAKILMLVLLMVLTIDIWLLYRTKNPFASERELPELLSLGDPNIICLQLKNNYRFKISVKIIDELPYQLQERDFVIDEEFDPQESREIRYTIVPDDRGEYRFGRINTFISGYIGLVMRRVKGSKPMMGKVFPSVIQMKKLEMLALS